MDDKAVVIDEKTPDVVEDLTPDPAEISVEEEGEAKPGDGQVDDGEVEIVVDGETHPKAGGTPRGFLKRINKLNGKVDKAQQETAGEKEKRLYLEDENRVLKIALDQSRGGVQPAAPVIPNPDDFDGGTYDPGYIQAVDAYHEQKIQAKVTEATQKVSQQTTVTATQQKAAQVLEESQTSHYERAEKLKVKDYAETEDKVIDIMGMDHVNHLIANLDNSEMALYYFGKNPEIAQKYSDMLKSRPIKALIEIGGLLSKIKVKPKSEPVPDPDTELEGGTPSNLEAMQTKLNKLREVARTGKGMNKVMDFKRQMKAKGITLR